MKMASYAQNHSLSAVARKYGIIDPRGRLSKGMTRLIIQGYEPKRPATRTRLGLPAKVHIPKPITINQLMQLPIQDQPAEILRLAYEFRRDMT